MNARESIKSRWQKQIAEDPRFDVYGIAIAWTLSLSAKADGTFFEDPKKRPAITTLA